ncbi:unnamed protein product, partial [Rotaria sp. Silwood1]
MYLEALVNDLLHVTVTDETIGLTGGHSDDLDTIATIQSLLHSKEEPPDSDEIVKLGVPADIEFATRPIVVDSPTPSAHGEIEKKRIKIQVLEITIDEPRPAARCSRPTRARTLDEIYSLYCIFLVKKKHSVHDFLSKILNILQESIEGLLTHSDIFYQNKVRRPMTYPQVLREKFDEFAYLMTSLMANIEFNEQLFQAEKILFDEILTADEIKRA